MRQPVIPQADAQTLADKGQDIAIDRIKTVRGCRRRQQRPQRKTQILFADDADHAKRGPAQRKRVLRSCRFGPDTEKPDKAVDLVRQRHCQPRRAIRNTVIRAFWPVMLFNGIGDICGDAVMARIMAAHDALQFGEFTHHARDKIGLGQLCGMRGHLCITMRNGRGDMRDQIFHPHRLVMHRPQPLIKGDVGQTRQHRLKRRLPVLVPEEFSIGKAGPQHALVTGKDHRIAVTVGQPVADNNKPPGEIASGGIGCRHIFLVGADRGFQHLVRQAHEAVFNLAIKRVGPFDQPGNFIQQALVMAQ